jgi:hypothetical protein
MTIHNVPFETSALGVPFVICLDGRVPRNDPMLGPTYSACIHCTPVCVDCFNTAVFPATCSIRELDRRLTAAGWTGIYCTCGGFLAVLRKESQ